MNGAFLNDFSGLFIKIFTDKINKNIFSIAARSDGILFISKKNGLNKKLNIFTGKGYEEMSIAEPVVEDRKSVV